MDDDRHSDNNAVLMADVIRIILLWSNSFISWLRQVLVLN